MAAEAGHLPNRSYIAQDGSFHVNGAGFWATETGDIGTSLATFTVPTPVTTYTQTYSTVQSTVPNATYAAPTIGANTVVLTATAIAAKTPSLTLIDLRTDTLAHACDDMTQDLMDIGTAINTNNTSVASLNTQLVALAADVLALKKVIGNVIDDLQALGLAG